MMIVDTDLMRDFVEEVDWLREENARLWRHVRYLQNELRRSTPRVPLATTSQDDQEAFR